MEVTVEKISNVNAFVSVQVNEADYQAEVEKQLKDLAKKVQLKGFRPGKVPVATVKQMFGKEVKLEKIGEIAAKALEQHLETNELVLVGSPLLAKEKMNLTNWENQKDFQFVYEIGIRPDINVKFDKSLKLKEYEVQVTQTDLDKFIDQLRDGFGGYDYLEQVVESGCQIYGAVEPVGDQSVNLPLSERIFAKGQSFFVVINIADIAEGQRSLFIGKKPQEEIIFDLNKALPNNDKVADVFSLDEEDAAMLKGDVKIVIESIRNRKPAELNSDFFTSVVGKEEENISVEEFRAKLINICQNYYNYFSKLYLSNNFILALEKKSESLELPTDFMKRWLIANNDKSIAESEERFEGFAQTIRVQTVLDKLGKNQNIEINPQDLFEYVKKREYMRYFEMGFFFILNNEDNLSYFANMFMEKKENQDALFGMMRMLLAERVFEAYSNDISLEKTQVSVEAFQQILKDENKQKSKKSKKSKTVVSEVVAS